jgi:hypothetical protein
MRLSDFTQLPSTSLGIAGEHTASLFHPGKTPAVQKEKQTQGPEKRPGVRKSALGQQMLCP